MSDQTKGILKELSNIQKSFINQILRQQTKKKELEKLLANINLGITETKLKLKATDIYIAQEEAKTDAKSN